MRQLGYTLTALRLTSADRKYPPYVLAETVTKMTNKQIILRTLMFIGLNSTSLDYWMNLKNRKWRTCWVLSPALLLRRVLWLKNIFELYSIAQWTFTFSKTYFYSFASYLFVYVAFLLDLYSELCIELTLLSAFCFVCCVVRAGLWSMLLEIHDYAKADSPHCPLKIRLFVGNVCQSDWWNPLLLA